MRKFFLLMILFFFVHKGEAMACSCVEYPGSLKEKITRNFNRSDYVFTGNVVSIEDPQEGSLVRSSHDGIHYEFEIIASLKGEFKTKKITIARPRDYSGFEIGQTYIVHVVKVSKEYYLSGSDINLITGDCRRNKNVKRLSTKERHIYKKMSVNKNKYLFP